MADDDDILAVEENADDAAMDAFYRGVVARIEEHGWIVQGVFGGDSVEGNFTYTAGLFRPKYGYHPELVITVPIDPRNAAIILNDMGSAITQGHRYELGPCEGLIAPPYVAHIIEVSVEKHEDYPLSVANNLLGVGPDHRVEALQIVIPNKDHLMPWDPGYDQEKLPQPLLGLPL